MHIAQFIKEDQRRNPPPKHWWQRKTPWYARMLMIATAIFGFGLALYLPLGYITMPVGIKEQAGMSGVIFIVAFTVFGLLMFGAGVMGSIRTFKRTMRISHGEAILVCIVGVLLVIPFRAVLNSEMDKGSKLTAETQQLQAKIKALEAAQ